MYINYLYNNNNNKVVCNIINLNTYIILYKSYLTKTSIYLGRKDLQKCC